MAGTLQTVGQNVRFSVEEMAVEIRIMSDAKDWETEGSEPPLSNDYWKNTTKALPIPGKGLKPRRSEVLSLERVALQIRLLFR